MVALPPREFGGEFGIAGRGIAPGVGLNVADNPELGGIVDYRRLRRRDAGLQIGQHRRRWRDRQILDPGFADIVRREIEPVVFQHQHAKLGVDEVVIGGHAIHFCRRKSRAQARLIFQFVRTFGIAPVVGRREGVAEISRPVFHLVGRPELDDRAEQVAGAAPEPGPLEPVAVSRLGQRGPVAARASWTQRPNRVQIIGFALAQSQVFGQGAQLRQLLVEERFDLGHFVVQASGAGFGFVHRPVVYGAFDVLQGFGVVVVGHGGLLIGYAGGSGFAGRFHPIPRPLAPAS